MPWLRSPLILSTLCLLAYLWDVIKHKAKVGGFLITFALKLLGRALLHDLSKFSPAEAIPFTCITPTFRKISYGSTIYQTNLDHLACSLHHHYVRNSHHPEHYREGVMGMDLLDLVEMAMDWRAAALQQDGSDPLSSLAINQQRFELSPELASILKNTLPNAARDADR